MHAADSFFENYGEVRGVKVIRINYLTSAWGKYVDRYDSAIVGVPYRCSEETVEDTVVVFAHRCRV